MQLVFQSNRGSARVQHCIYYRIAPHTILVCECQLLLWIRVFCVTANHIFGFSSVVLSLLWRNSLSFHCWKQIWKKSCKWQDLLTKDLAIEEYVGVWRKILPPEHYHSLHEGQRDSHTDFFHVTVPRTDNIFGLLKVQTENKSRLQKQDTRLGKSRNTNFIQ